jgi:hypothetical protein
MAFARAKAFQEKQTQDEQTKLPEQIFQLKILKPGDAGKDKQIHISTDIPNILFTFSQLPEVW